MNFQRGRQKEDPEINLVPMIDVLLVILIFLVITTTYSKFAELEISLPQSHADVVDKNIERPNVIEISVDAASNYVVNNKQIKFNGINSLKNALHTAADGKTDPLIIINADAKATHQSVINIMEASRMTGYNKITFTAEISSTD